MERHLPSRMNFRSKGLKLINFPLFDLEQLYYKRDAVPNHVTGIITPVNQYWSNSNG